MTTEERVKKLHEAARATALARELMSQWNIEQVGVRLAVHNKEGTKAAKCQALMEELLKESRILTDRAEAIYKELRG